MSKAPMPDSASGDAPMPSSFDDDLDFWDEGRYNKLWRRLKEEPLIPFGLALTCYALYGATRSIRRGDKEQTNRYFRARVYAQAFTLLVLVAGSIYWKGDREKRKVYSGLLAEKKAKEKKEAWLKELEARDREDKIERERIRARRAARGTSKPLIREEPDNDEKSQTSAGGTGDTAACPMDDRDMRSAILGPAMRLWWSREPGSQ